MSEALGTSVARRVDASLGRPAGNTRSVASNGDHEGRAPTRCENWRVARIVGLDVGERRIGVAVSDVSGTLARPLGVLKIPSLDASAVALVAADSEAPGR